MRGRIAPLGKGESSYKKATVLDPRSAAMTIASLRFSKAGGKMAVSHCLFLPNQISGELAKGARRGVFASSIFGSRRKVSPAKSHLLMAGLLEPGVYQIYIL